MLKNILKKYRGESIIETIITIGIIVVSLVGIMSLFLGTIKLNQSIRERVIAINLAREGMEAVRYIRDTNWLIYSNNRRICWNLESGNCNESGIEGVNDNYLSGYYTIEMNPTDFSWSIQTDNTEDVDLNNQLFLKDNFYCHDNTGTFTPFLRQIEIRYPQESNPHVITDKTKDNVIQVISRIKWNNHEVKLETKLTDFFERQWHDS